MGQPRNPALLPLLSADLIDQPLDVSYVDNTDIGTATASATYDGDTNHEADDGENTFVITFANASCTITPYTVQFDGYPHFASGFCTGIGGESLEDPDLSNTVHTEIGIYSDTWSFSDSSGIYAPRKWNHNQYHHQSRSSLRGKPLF